MSTTRRARRAIQNTLNLLRGAIEAAVQRDIISANPAAGIKIPRRVAPTREPWTFLTLEEQQAVARCRDIPEAHRVMIAFAIGTGLRLGEMMNLELADLHVDGPHPEVVVRFGSRGKGTKNAKIRRVPLFSVGLEAARRWLELLPGYAAANPHMTSATPAPPRSSRGCGAGAGRSKR